MNKPQTYGPDMDGAMVPDDADEWVQLSDYESLVNSKNQMQTAFNNAIDFAIDFAGEFDNGVGCARFLTLWRAGCWPEIREEFPEFIEPYGYPSED